MTIILQNGVDCESPALPDPFEFQHRVFTFIHSRVRKLAASLQHATRSHTASRITTAMRLPTPHMRSSHLCGESSSTSAEPPMDVPCTTCIICAWNIIIGQCTTTQLQSPAVPRPVAHTYPTSPNRHANHMQSFSRLALVSSIVISQKAWDPTNLGPEIARS